MRMKRIGCILLVLFVAVAGFVVYTVWSIFGWQTMLASMIISLISGTFLYQSFGSRKTDSEGIIYNPKEWPKYLYMLISLAIFFYLYRILHIRAVTGKSYIFGILYIVLVGLIPILLCLYHLFRNRNDYVRITESGIEYNDNGKHNVSLESAKSFDLLLNGDIEISFDEGEKQGKIPFILPTSRMNFNRRDLRDLIADLRSRIEE